MRNNKKALESLVAKTMLAMQDTCPPDLYAIIKKEGNIASAAKATGLAKYTIAQIGKGRWKMTPKIQAKLDAYLAHGPRKQTPTEKKPMPEAKPEAEAVTIPPWDKKMVSHKFVNNTTGKKTTIKVPALIAELLTRHGNVKNSTGRALGFSGYSGIQTALENGKYESKLHARAYCAVNDLPIPTNGKHETTGDAFTLGLAICLVGLSDFERVEEIADIMGGVLVFKMTAGSTGWWAIYRIAHRDKLEKFKRLASRDAKKIVCP